MLFCFSASVVLCFASAVCHSNIIGWSLVGSTPETFTTCMGVYSHVMVDFVSNVLNASALQLNGSWWKEEKAQCLFGWSRIYCINFEGIHLEWTDVHYPEAFHSAFDLQGHIWHSYEKVPVSHIFQWWLLSFYILYFQGKDSDRMAGSCGTNGCLRKFGWSGFFRRILSCCTHCCICIV